MCWKCSSGSQHALAEMGDIPRATAALREALTIGEPGNYLCTFVEAGQPSSRSLFRGLGESAVRQRLLEAFQGEPPSPGPGIARNEFLEGLTGERWSSCG